MPRRPIACNWRKQSLRTRDKQYMPLKAPASNCMPAGSRGLAVLLPRTCATRRPPLMASPVVWGARNRPAAGRAASTAAVSSAFGRRRGGVMGLSSCHEAEQTWRGAAHTAPTTRSSPSRTLEQRAQRAARHAARVRADAGCRQPCADGGHQVCAAGDVAAAGRERAACVLDEAAHDEVCGGMRCVGGGVRLMQVGIWFARGRTAAACMHAARMCVNRPSRGRPDASERTHLRPALLAPPPL